MFGQAYMDKVSKETCECINKKKLDLKTISKEKIQLEFGLCALKAYNLYSKEFPKSKKLNYSNKSQLEQFGVDIALNMSKDCPDIILALGKMYSSNNYVEKDTDEEIEVDTVNTEAPDDDITITGVYQGTKTDGFYYITVKETSGKINQMALINNFENSFLILDKVLQLNDKVEVSYFDAELFDVILNRFVTVKVISDIKKL